MKGRRTVNAIETRQHNMTNETINRRVEKITQKQKAFIIKLDATQNEETLNDLTVKEASYLIKSLLKGNTTKAQSGFKPCNLSIVDYEALKIKYNVSYKLGKDGQYNNNNGSNCHSPLLQDSRKFKSFINNVFKTEFKGVDISSKVSFAYNCYDNVEITIRAPKNELYSSYTLLGSQGRNACYRYTRNELTNAATAALYDRVIKNSEEQRNTAFLSDKYLKLYNFITDLLSSYSYNHSDIMTDYFDSGLSFVIYFEATDREEINNESRVYDMNSDEIIKQFGLADEVSEEAQARADKIEKEIEERRKQQEEENKKREELARIAKLKNKEINERIEQEELKEEDYYFIKGYFSNFNKACSIDEVNEYINDPKIGLEDINGTYCQIVKVINFTNKEDYDYFTTHFMSDWDFIAKIGGCAYINTKTMEDLGYTEDLYRMPESERTVKNIGWARSCALIKLNGENKLLIDPEGFNYCRYVGIIA